MKKKLRPYQLDLVKNVLIKVKTAEKGVFFVLPPGGGKTMVLATFANIFTNKMKRNVLCFVHRTEIVDQIKSTFKEQGVDMSKAKVGMVQTFRNRVSTLEKPDLILVDEAHHSAANSYKIILDEFPDAVKLFCTATPWRGDGQGFEDLANNEDLVVGPNVNWMIEHGYLAPFDYYTIDLFDKKELVFSKKSGDYTQKSIDDVASKIDPGKIVKEYKRLGNNQQGLVYASTISQSKSIVECFNDNGIKAVHLDGGSEPGYRKRMLEEYKAGNIQVISNVQIFTEGVDLPNAYVAMIARPTNSVALYFQFAMRVLRPLEGKRATIIDFAGVANKLGLPNSDFAWSLRPHDIVDNDESENLYTCDNCGFTFEKRMAKTVQDEDIPENFNVLCPNCGQIVTVLEAKSQNNDEEETLREAKKILKVDDYETFYNEWLKNAELELNKALGLNAEILNAKKPNISFSELFNELIAFYMNKSKLSINEIGFSDDEIDGMYSRLSIPTEEQTFRDKIEILIDATSYKDYLHANITTSKTKVALCKTIERKLKANVADFIEQTGIDDKKEAKLAAVKVIEDDLYKEIISAIRKTNAKADILQEEAKFVKVFIQNPGDLPQGFPDAFSKEFDARRKKVLKNKKPENKLRFEIAEMTKTKSGTRGICVQLMGVNRKIFKKYLWCKKGSRYLSYYSVLELRLIDNKIIEDMTLQETVKELNTKLKNKMINVNIKKDPENPLFRDIEFTKTFVD